jgi:hypothetical protein
MAHTCSRAIAFWSSSVGWLLSFLDLWGSGSPRLVQATASWKLMLRRARHNTLPTLENYTVLWTGNVLNWYRNILRPGPAQVRKSLITSPVTGDLKAEQRMGRNYLAHRAGDAINAMLAAAGYNFPLLLKWLGTLAALTSLVVPRKPPPPIVVEIENFTET